MDLTESRLTALLAPRPLRFYQQADSTNDLALNWLNQGASSGSVVVADEQLKGKGRLGRQGPGELFLSKDAGRTPAPRPSIVLGERLVEGIAGAAHSADRVGFA